MIKKVQLKKSQNHIILVSLPIATTAVLNCDRSTFQEIILQDDHSIKISSEE